MRIRVLVEGPSEFAFLSRWLTRYKPQHYFQIVTHRGKGRLPNPPAFDVKPKREGLLDQLPAKLRGYGLTLNSDTDRVLVIVDADDDDCRVLKKRLTATLEACDLAPVTVFRIAVEEIEAFYLGDFAAIRDAYPKAKRQEYEQDSVCGTWEVFQATIGSQVEAKVEWGRQMGEVLGIDPSQNQSPSFRQFCNAIDRLCGDA